MFSLFVPLILGYGATIYKPFAYWIDHILYSIDITLNGIKIMERMACLTMMVS